MTVPSVTARLQVRRRQAERVLSLRLPAEAQVTVDGFATISAAYDAQDRILSSGTAQYKHSDHGDLEKRTDSANSLTLTHDELGQLQEAVVVKGSTKTINYVIDGLGRRVARKLNGGFDRAWLYRDALRPISEIDSAGTFTHYIYANDSDTGAPDTMVRSGVPYRLVKDHLGSVRRVINAQTGAVAQSIEYDAFGQILSDTSPGFQPFGFAGGLYDWDTGLTHFGAREYDPSIGR